VCQGLLSTQGNVELNASSAQTTTIHGQTTMNADLTLGASADIGKGSVTDYLSRIDYMFTEYRRTISNSALAALNGADPWRVEVLEVSTTGGAQWSKYVHGAAISGASLDLSSSTGVEGSYALEIRMAGNTWGGQIESSDLAAQYINYEGTSILSLSRLLYSHGYDQQPNGTNRTYLPVSWVRNSSKDAPKTAHFSYGAEGDVNGYQNLAQNTTSQTVQFNIELFDTDDTFSNHSFVAPQSGVYHFDCNFLLIYQGTTVQRLDTELVQTRSGSDTILALFSETTLDGQSTEKTKRVHFSTTVQLEKSDSIQVRVKRFETTATNMKIYMDNSQTQFSGFYVSDQSDDGHPRLVWEAHLSGPTNASGKLYLEFRDMNGKSLSTGHTSDLRFALKPVTATPSFAY
jgi:hypothetical protein